MGAIAPSSAYRTKRRIWEIPRFSTSETVFYTGIDSKNDLKHVLKRLLRGGGGRANFSKLKLIN